jgi:hypothetical protein
MAMDIAPKTAHAIEISSAVQVDQITAFRPLNDEGLVLGHLRERVPDEAPIPRFDLLARR